MADVIWPALLAPTAGGNPVPAFANVSGPTTSAGQAQTVASDAGFWTLTMGQVPIYDEQRWRAWNATQLQLNGRARSCLIPIFSRAWAPFPDFYGKKIKPKKRGANPPGALIYVTLETAIVQGLTTTTLRLKNGSPLAAGIHFSVAERLYAIQSIGDMTRSGNDRLYPVVLWPPPRDGVVAGTRLEFDAPMFRARLATDDEMKIDPDLLSMGATDVKWVEDT